MLRSNYENFKPFMVLGVECCPYQVRVLIETQPRKKVAWPASLPSNPVARGVSLRDLGLWGEINET